MGNEFEFVNLNPKKKDLDFGYDGIQKASDLRDMQS